MIAQNMARRNSSASKIQACVRGYFARKGYSQQKQAVARIQSGNLHVAELLQVVSFLF
jgi:hypothetical protein